MQECPSGFELHSSQDCFGQPGRLIGDLSLGLLSCFVLFFSWSWGVRHFNSADQSLAGFNPFKAYLTPFRAKGRALPACVTARKHYQRKEQKRQKAYGVI